MIAKYFLHGENEIPIDTARNYFAARKGVKPAKFIEIADKDKLFIISPRTEIIPFKFQTSRILQPDQTPPLVI